MSDDILKIDIDALLQSRLPRHYRFIPRWAIKWLKRTIHEDVINNVLATSHGLEGVDFAEHVLNYLNVNVDIEGMEHLQPGKRYIFVANHPLGGLDGIALISHVGRHYNSNIRFMVNDLLMAIKPLKSLFLPINKHGRQSRDAAKLISQQYSSDNQMLTFPAGLCSRLQDDGTVADLKWNKHAVVHAIHDQRDVVPVYVDAVNSRFFYLLAKWRKRLGIKFNIEMLYLPDEMFKKRNSTFKIYIGEPIAWQSLDAARPLDEAARLRNIVYKLIKHPL